MDKYIVFMVLLAIILVILINLIKKIRAKRKIEKEVLIKGFDYLVDSLNSKDNSIREEAINRLGSLEDPRSVDALINFINLPEVREEEDVYWLSLTINALFLKEDKKAVDFLVKSLKSENFGFKFLICQGILNLNEERIPLYRDALEPINSYINELLEAKEKKDPKFYNEYLVTAREALKRLNNLIFKM